MNPYLFMARFLAFNLVLLALSGTSSASDDWSPSAYLAKVHFDPDLGMITVPIIIGRQKCLAILDTGSSRTIVGSQYKSVMGPYIKDVRLATSNGHVVLKEYKCPHFIVAESKYSVDSVCLQDLSYSKMVNGVAVEAIIGMDFLSRFALFVDYDNGTLFFVDRIVECAALGRKLPLSMDDNNIPFCEFEIAGIKTAAMVDTGNLESLSLNNRLFNDLEYGKKIDARCKPQWLLSGDSAINVLRCGRANVTFSGISIENVYVSRSTQSLIGLRFLSKVRWAADFPNAKIFVRPGKHVSSFDHGDSDGLSVGTATDHVIITDVYPDSVAEKCGAKRGDLISCINGNVIEKDGRYLVTRILKRYRDAPMTITVQRGSDRVQIELPK